MNYPTLKLDINRVHAAELGLTQKDIVGNVITALNSNMMIAPNFWVDYKTGNDYFLTVQYYENGPSAIHNFVDLTQIPLRRRTNDVRPATPGYAFQGVDRARAVTTLGNVSSVDFIQSPTEIDHYQIQRVADVYVTPSGEDLGKVTAEIRRLLAGLNLPS